MDSSLLSIIQKEMEAITAAGLFKEERIISSSQGREIEVSGRTLLNFCANNYLGLGNNKELIEAAKKTLDRWGFGLSSVRFICGTQEIHKELEQKLAKFLGTEDVILYSSCFDANGGLFGTMLTEEDAIITDSLNHASIIDGIRLTKAERHIFTHM
ncbi:MAG: aminotransferase class I/II-fold pyridoxal phosphate-dependent enzyme, partial [bacterium]|nr:aminotransferase class I/II-fold pyridoxal phosphate-dependent enzyme [bacterium]